MVDDRLPSFKNPPVVETVLGVQFRPLQKFSNAHLGAFWRQLGAEWPNVQDRPPLRPVLEQFAEQGAWAGIGPQLTLTQDPASRLQILNETRSRMIQIQNGRLHFNWLGEGGGKYPRYSIVRPEFETVLAILKEFISGQDLGDLEPNQWEVTYVNHIPKGTVWNEPTDWSSLFPTLAGPFAGTSGVRFESVGGQWHFEIEPQRGRLHVELRHGSPASADSTELLKMTLTARGPVAQEESEGLSLDQGLDLGHKTVVTMFKNLTSPTAHEVWGLYDERV